MEGRTSLSMMAWARQTASADANVLMRIHLRPPWSRIMFVCLRESLLESPAIPCHAGLKRDEYASAGGP
eukprot:13170939-Alexandrium_andersonii.AAC.1